MNIGITVYPTYGGSGIVGSELGRDLAERGHNVHFISSFLPTRVTELGERVHFHEVEMMSYPLFEHQPYDLALATKMATVARAEKLDLLHVHYAIPHSISAILARESIKQKRYVPVITTLHGTDITLVGSDPSYARAVAFSIEQSHGVTAVSQSLKADTISFLGIRHEIAVIPNFLDCSEYRRRPDAGLRARLCPPDRYDALVIHVSNFRPVKRVDAALEVFRLIRRRVRARFALVGDGPVRPEVEQMVSDYALQDDVIFLGEQQDLVGTLSAADLFPLPSAQESFGLAALEAMACEVPVVASKVGGLPEIIEDGVTGFVCPPDAIHAMAERGIALLTDTSLRTSIASAAAHLVRSRYCTDAVVPIYETEYVNVLRQPVSGS